MKTKVLLHSTVVRRLADSFLHIPGMDKRAKLSLARKLASAFLQNACLSSFERRKYLDDFIFHVGEFAADISKLCDVLNTPGSIGAASIKKVLEEFFCHAANHVHAAATLYTGWGMTYLVPIDRPAASRRKSTRPRRDRRSRPSSQ